MAEERTPEFHEFNVYRAATNTGFDGDYVEFWLECENGDSVRVKFRDRRAVEETIQAFEELLEHYGE